MLYTVAKENIVIQGEISHNFQLQLWRSIYVLGGNTIQIGLLASNSNVKKIQNIFYKC